MQFETLGATAYAYTAGKPLDPAKPTVVFIHGAANDHSVWALQSRWFAHHGWNALAVDLPGHGRSAGEAPASVEALATWLAGALDAIGIESAALVGHSMGSLVALEVAGRLPQRATRLALVGCAVPMAVADPLLAAARDDTPRAIDLITGWSHAPATLRAGGPIPGLWLPGVNRALMRRAAPGLLHRDLLNCRDYAGGLAAAAKVTCPTLLVTGERDLMTPKKAAQALKAALPDVREAMVAGAGHAMMSERADVLLDALREFLGPGGRVPAVSAT
jgi:pimeloyl-ACP methyl ester carboxylesterase